MQELLAYRPRTPLSAVLFDGDHAKMWRIGFHTLGDYLEPAGGYLMRLPGPPLNLLQSILSFRQPELQVLLQPRMLTVVHT